MCLTAREALPFAFLDFQYCIGRNPSRLVRARLISAALTASDPMPRIPGRKAKGVASADLQQVASSLTPGIRRSSHDYFTLKVSAGSIGQHAPLARRTNGTPSEPLICSGSDVLKRV